MIVGIALAGGKGSRMKLKGANKTTVAFDGKPLIAYAAELYEKTTDKTVIVVGAHAESVKKALSDHPTISYAYQRKRLGTGHAVRVAVETMIKEGIEPKTVLIGYGDHMMFYTPAVVEKLLSLHEKEQALVSLVSTDYPDPNELAWGRIIRNNQGKVQRIVEQKDATEAERMVKEVNPGFYCVDYSFLQYAVKHLKKSPITGEYYLTELIEMAAEKERIAALKVTFKEVGLGINTMDQLEESKELLIQ